MDNRILSLGLVGLVLLAARPASAADAGSDAGADAGDGGLVCPNPAVETGYTPPAYVHAVPHQNACSQQLIDDYYTLCLSSTETAQTCAPFTTTPDPAHQACAACLVTPSTASAYGPVIQTIYGNFIVSSPNLGGCVELLNPSDLACATTFQDVDDCNGAACDTQCPIVDDTSFGLWQQCLTNADNAATSCGTYYQGTTCGDVGTDAAIAQCFTTGANPQFSDNYAAIAPVFCLDVNAPDGGSTSDSGGAGDASSGDASSGADGGGTVVDASGADAGMGDAATLADATTGADAAGLADGGPVTTRPDASSGEDAGEGSASSKSGCGCRTAPATDGPFALVGLAGVAVLLRRRRRSSR